MNRIPNPIATAAAAMLAPYHPGLTPERLESALATNSGCELGDELMTRQEACDVLRISKPTCDRMLNDGELECVKIRRRVFVRASSVRSIVAGKQAA